MAWIEIETIEAADHVVWHWRFSVPWPLRLGTEQHMRVLRNKAA